MTPMPGLPRPQTTFRPAALGSALMWGVFEWFALWRTRRERDDAGPGLRPPRVPTRLPASLPPR
jgi:hypothetical protein